MVNQEWLDRVNAALIEAAPLTSQDPKAVSALKEKIHTYCHELGKMPTELQVVQWSVPFEQALLAKQQQAEEAARKKQERIDARKKEREFDKLPASEAKARANAELRQQREQATTERFTPEREYSRAEIDKMSDSEAKRLLFGIESESINESRPDERIRQANEKRLLHTKRSQDTPLRRALRREILEGLQNG